MENKIVGFINCAKCIKELPVGKSPREFCHNKIGWTQKGLQVWCVRHECEVITLDFKGQKVGVERHSKNGSKKKSASKKMRFTKTSKETTIKT